MPEVHASLLPNLRLAMRSLHDWVDGAPRALYARQGHPVAPGHCDALTNYASESSRDIQTRYGFITALI